VPVGCNVGPAPAAGAGLVEVAVALLLISLATIGLAGLQISAKALGHEAIQLDRAVELASGLLERMRVNRGGLPAYADASIAIASGESPGKPPGNCDHQPCSGAQMSAWDLWTWRRALAGAGLVNAAGCVAIDKRLVTVQITWEGRYALAGPAADNGCGSERVGEVQGRRRSVGFTAFVGEF